MRLQQNTLLALYSALEFGADPERRRSVAEIADMYKVSEHHLAKVLRKLRMAGLLSAVRGAGGGYRFTGNPKRVTLADVIGLFEKIGAVQRPANRRRRDEQEALEEIFADIDENAKATFHSITLATMVKLIARRKYRDVA